MTTGRFAPSPSGALHIGNLRTALLAWCFARSVGGSFLVRMEDLTTAAEGDWEREQLEDLELLGLDHDGLITRQSERRDRHAEVLDELVDRGLTYECFCTRREIREAAAAPHGPAAEGAYPGTCADLSAEEVTDRRREGRPAALRLRAGTERVEVNDRLCGTASAVVDDFVLRRGDGVVAYNLAVVVDDADSGVDQVVRGDDLLDTTARHVLLQRLLGLPIPEYAHVPLAIGADGEPLSKRHGSVGLRDHLDRGMSPAGVVGMLAASAGFVEAGTELTAEEVLGRFDPDRIGRRPWVWTAAEAEPWLHRG